MFMLMLLHQTQMVAQFTRHEKRWPAPQELNPRTGGLFISELRGKTVGILGYGHIGREVARLSTCFGARVIACTRSGTKQSLRSLYPEMGDPAGDLPQAWYKSVDAESTRAFLQECDILVNLLPSAPENVNYLGRDEIMAMKDTALLINVGRGDTIDQDGALLEALRAGLDGSTPSGASGTLRIGGAAVEYVSSLHNFRRITDRFKIAVLPSQSPCLMAIHCSVSQTLSSRLTAASLR